jgi:hypothetical protein
MRHYLDTDHTQYGMSTEYDIEKGEADEWLGDVDNAVTKANA